VERFPSYRSFAAASLGEIVGDPLLQQGRRLEAATLEAGILVNDGAAQFTWRELPRIAQVAPGFGVAATDFDGDSRPDVILAQNFFGPVPETGRLDGGLGQLLAGELEGRFRPVEPRVSGLVIPGDAKSAGVADFNGDGRPDLLVGVNDSEWLVFTNAISTRPPPLNIRLRGKPGNPTAVGARVTVRMTDGAQQCAEVHAGGGYLSQSTARLYFGREGTRQVQDISVRWPDGTVTLTNGAQAGREMVLSLP
jgi:hypothetical protein